MRYLKFMIALVCLWSIGFCVDAAVSDPQSGEFPKGCMPVAYHFLGNQIVLDGPTQPGQQLVYLFNNIANTSIYLDHPADIPGTASAGWMSQLDPQQWSGLTVSRPNFNWTCQVVGMASLQDIACSSVLKVCRFTEKFSKTPVTDQSWLAENGSIALVMGTIKIRNLDIITKVPTIPSSTTTQ